MESKIGVTERLRREGRWDEASQYRDETRRQFRADGRSKTEAGEAAWVAMVQKYSPLAAAPDSTTDQDDTDQDDPGIEELVARCDGSDPDLAADVLWVYRSIRNAGARAIDAPSLGAWSMLKWAREAPNRFFEQMLPKALAIQENQPIDEDEDEDEDESRDLGLDRLRKFHEERNAVRKAIAELVETTVPREVTTFVADWERHSHLTLGKEAHEDMTNGMVKIAQESIKAYQNADLRPT